MRPPWEGIWLLVQRDDRPPYVRARVRKKHDARFAQYVEQAKFLKSVYPLAADKRFDLAVRTLSHETLEVAMSAAHVAVASDPRGAEREVLKRAADPGLPVTVQVAFDHAYLKRFRAEWRTADRRAKFVAAWPGQTRDADTLKFLLSDFAYRCQNPTAERQDVPEALAAAGIAAVATNEKNPKATRLTAISSLTSLTYSVGIVGPVFDALVAVVETSKDADLRRAAAANLPRLVRPKPMYDRKPTFLNVTQIERLIGLHKKEADKEVEKALFEAIEKASDAALNRKPEP